MTIEQRAKAYEEDYPNMDDSYYSYYVRDGYIKGATEQRKIDIEKACEWLLLHSRDALAHGYNLIEGKFAIGDKFIENFRKAMEG